jgi:hypothetical protein
MPYCEHFGAVELQMDGILMDLVNARMAVEISVL